MLRFILGLSYFFKFFFFFASDSYVCWIRNLCISFTSCLFPVEGGSKTFGNLEEFNSMRTGELKILGLGSFFGGGGGGWGRNFVRGKGSVYHYMP